jgi:ADP-ribose pyrophosphatase YjhB (NUDIX family)
MDRFKTYRHCPLCGAKLEPKQLKPLEPLRLVCSECGFVFYLDPKVAACLIIERDRKIVLARRAISPGRGKWVLPGGFVDVGEPVPVAAVREAREEVCLKVTVGSLVGVYSYPDIAVVVVVYEAFWRDGLLRAGEETLEARLFDPRLLPWEDLAFSSTRDALRDYLDGRLGGERHGG